MKVFTSEEWEELSTRVNRALLKKEELRKIHTEIILALEKRGYFHNANGECIGIIIDNLTAENKTLQNELANLQDDLRGGQ